MPPAPSYTPLPPSPHARDAFAPLLAAGLDAQTGSGKTFTTFGPGAAMESHLNPADPKSYELRGLVPRVLEYLYDSITRQVGGTNGKVTYTCRCSFYEIFNEKVFDLVDDSNRDNPMGLSVREDTRKGVHVEGLMEEEVRAAFSRPALVSPPAPRPRALWCI